MQDDDSGLVYAGARYLDPIIGRFLSIDPAPVETDKPESFNKYVYASNNPYKYVDPSGRSPIDSLVLLLEPAGKSYGALVAYGVGYASSDQNLMNAAEDGMHDMQDSGINSLGVAAANFATLPGSSVTKAVTAAEDVIVYLRTHTSTGEKYIGQSKSEDRFAARQKEHDRDNGTKFQYDIVGRGRPGKNLDVLEESKIREYGGIKDRGGELANKRHQMSDDNYKAAGGNVKLPY